MNLTPAKMVMFVFVAIGALIVVYLVKTLTAREPPPARAAMRTVPLTLSPLEPGTVITSMHVGLGPAPADQVVGDILLTVEGIVGRVVKERIPVTEFVRGSDLYPIGQQPPLVTHDGFTAMTIPIEETSSMVEGLFRPDERVDIFYLPKDQQGDPRYKEIGGMAIKLFKGIRVVAINRSFVQKALQASRNSVTLEIRNDDAALLTLAQSTGKLSFSATADDSATATVKVANPERPTLEELLDLPEIPEDPEPPEPDRFVTNIWRRGSHSVRRFVDGVPDASGGTVFFGNNNTNTNRGNPNTYGGTGGGLDPSQPGVAPNGVWSPGPAPQPGSIPLAPPGQERLGPQR